VESLAGFDGLFLSASAIPDFFRKCYAGEIDRNWLQNQLFLDLWYVLPVLSPQRQIAWLLKTSIFNWFCGQPILLHSIRASRCFSFLRLGWAVDVGYSLTLGFFPLSVVRAPVDSVSGLSQESCPQTRWVGPAISRRDVLISMDKPVPISNVAEDPQSTNECFSPCAVRNGN
jgi:hypothetical protein